MGRIPAMKSYFKICLSYSEDEKQRRWQQIRIRQHNLKQELEQQQTPAHIEQIMRSGFSMSDIKGMQSNYDEGDEMLKSEQNLAKMKRPPPRGRKGSLVRNMPQYEGEQGLYKIFGSGFCM